MFVKKLARSSCSKLFKKQSQFPATLIFKPQITTCTKRFFAAPSSPDDDIVIDTEDEAQIEQLTQEQISRLKAEEIAAKSIEPFVSYEQIDPKRLLSSSPAPSQFNGKSIPSPLFGIEHPSLQVNAIAKSVFHRRGRNIELAHSVGKEEELPPETGKMPEIALVGRSNAGKSSLINVIFDNDDIAKVSSKPGHTKRLHFYKLDRQMYIVDMPGYGFAEGSKEKIEAWNDLIVQYLTRRNTLMRVFVLMDARRGITRHDDQFLQLLSSTGVSHQIVLTKCDLIDHTKLVQTMDAIYKELKVNSKYGMCYPLIIPTSSEAKLGIEELLGNMLLASGLLERMVLIPEQKKQEIAAKESAAYKMIQQYSMKKAEQGSLQEKKKKNKKVEKQMKKIQKTAEQDATSKKNNMDSIPKKKSIIVGLHGEDE